MDLIPGPRTSDSASCSVMEAPGSIYNFFYQGGAGVGAPCETAAADDDIFFVGTWSYRKGDGVSAGSAMFDLVNWVCPAPKAPR